MYRQKIKISVAAAFLLFAVCAFLLAQKNFVVRAGDTDILKVVAKYKTWKQINKQTLAEEEAKIPAEEIDSSSKGVSFASLMKVSPDTAFTIDNSSEFG